VSPTRRRTASLGLAAVALVTAGCGSPSSDSTRAEAPSSGPSSAPSSQPSSESPTPPSSGTSYPRAAGPEVMLQSFTARAPSRWTLDHGFGRSIVFADDPHFRDEFTFSDTSIYPGTPLARAERIVSRDDTWTHPPRRLPRVVLDGETFFHLAGPAAGRNRYDVYAHVAGSRLVELAFQTDESRAVRQRLIGSVLATVRLR
jgi:hypothetical protein